ncbi:hypothetical protein MA16_Dca027098 [Dendrobium catenatum]|uniref:Uncharacterized protein n=1 Tax=Dendrobium catenatum TaxID=906689 RepID=A0A2I0VYZ0_9ASPA|nr:hypothetical protein MA16_Dca027098 [Dendrobium catenatum]
MGGDRRKDRRFCARFSERRRLHTDLAGFLGCLRQIRGFRDFWRDSRVSIDASDEYKEEGTEELCCWEGSRRWRMRGSSDEELRCSGSLKLDSLGEAVNDAIDVAFHRVIVLPIWFVERRSEDVDHSLCVVSKVVVDLRIGHTLLERRGRKVVFFVGFQKHKNCWASKREEARGRGGLG